MVKNNEFEFVNISMTIVQDVFLGSLSFKPTTRSTFFTKS